MGRLYRSGLLSCSLLVVVFAAGCGILERDLFPNQAVNDDGEPLFIEDLQEVTQDFSRPDQTMRNNLLDLGIENEELIDALIADGLPDVGSATQPGGGAGDGGVGDGTDGDAGDGSQG